MMPSPYRFSRKHPHLLDEPTPVSEDLVEFGDERILAIDFTEGGAPIGLTEREFREMEARMAGSAPWALAKSILREVVHASGLPDARDAVGYVQFLGRGLSHDVYGASTQLSDREAWLVVNWADALLGDPAYDLAIVTRGGRRPFGNKDGLQRLIEAYNRRSSRPLTVTSVHVHELILSGKWYLDRVTNYGRGSPHAENQRHALRAILTRAVRTHD